VAVQRGGAHPHRDADVPVTVTYEVTTSVATRPLYAAKTIDLCLRRFQFLWWRLHRPLD